MSLVVPTALHWIDGQSTVELVAGGISAFDPVATISIHAHGLDDLRRLAEAVAQDIMRFRHRITIAQRGVLADHPSGVAFVFHRTESLAEAVGGAVYLVVIDASDGLVAV